MEFPNRMRWPIVRASLWAAAFLTAGGTAPAQQPPAAAQDESAIRAATRSYLDALDRGDGEALAALWTADGDIVDDEGGVTNGREAVSRISPPPQGGPRQAVRIHETRLRFLTADVALEDGTVEVTPPGAARPHRGWFSATWVRREGGWKLAGLRESRISSPRDDAALEDLAWMVGDWTVAEETAGDAAAGRSPRIELSVRWNPTRTFLVRDLTIFPAGAAADGGAAPDAPAPTQITQRIGWDPLSKRIVSWVFGSDGSHGEAIWSRDDDTWIARTTAVLPDGTQTATVNMYTYDGADRCTWRSIPTHVGSEHAPHVSMTMIRMKPASPPPPPRAR